jgi:hypothetical protein
MSKLEERHVVQRVIGEADLKLRSARALLHQSYTEMEAKILSGERLGAPDIIEGRDLAVLCTDCPPSYKLEHSPA